MEKTIIKSLVLLLSIPLINFIALNAMSSSHEMYESIITIEHFEAYQFSIIFILIVMGVAVPLFEGLFDSDKISNVAANILYIISFTVITYVTYDQFAFHPFEHSLTLLSIISILFIRELMNSRVVGGMLYA